MLHGANVGHFSNGDVTVVASGYFLLCGFSVSPDNRYLGILIVYVIAIHVNSTLNTKSMHIMYMHDIYLMLFVRTLEFETICTTQVSVPGKWRAEDA